MKEQYRILKTNWDKQEYFKIQKYNDSREMWVDWECYHRERFLPCIPGKKVIDPNQAPDLWIKNAAKAVVIPIYRTEHKARNQIAFLIRQLENRNELLFLEQTDLQWKHTGYTQAWEGVSEDNGK